VSHKKKLGIVQSRGLGDIIIALPIAGHFRDEGYDIVWPVLEEFVPGLEQAAPWVHWVPLPYDPQGKFFYDIAMQRLRNLKVDDTLCLYQSLTGHDFHEERYFQYTSFDKYKYIRAGVPFLKKWELSKYITRNYARELDLYKQVVKADNYAVLHLEGSDHRANFDTSIIPNDWQTIEIVPMPGFYLLDWLYTIEMAQSIIMVDSVYANLVDQLGIGDDRYFIQRSHVGLTPVHGHHWTWI